MAQIQDQSSRRELWSRGVSRGVVAAWNRPGGARTATGPHRNQQAHLKMPNVPDVGSLTGEDSKGPVQPRRPGNLPELWS